MDRLRRRARIAVLGLMLGGLLTGMTGVGAATAADDPDARTVRVGLGTACCQPWGMNPFNSWTWYPTILAYETLAGLDENLEAMPAFAESWEASDDGATWTLRIAPDKKWSDGEPATARDVVFTYNYLLDSVGTDNELTLGFNHTGGVKANLESIEAPDDQTVVFHLKAPSRFPLESSIWIVPEHVWKDISYADALNTFQNDPPVVGSGPFIVTEFKTEQFVRLERNPFWGGPGPNVDTILINVYKSPEAAAQALRAGEVDAMEGLPVAMFDDFDADPAIVAESGITPMYVYLGFNMPGKAGGANTDAMGDQAFRDAIGYAIDKEALATRIGQGHLTPGLSIVSPISPAYFASTKTAIGDAVRTFDLAEAARRLDAAGYRDSDGDGSREDKEGAPLELRLVFASDSPDQAQTAQFVTDWLGQIGIKVTPNGIDGATLWDTVTKTVDSGDRDWELALGSYWAEPYGPTWFECWTSHGSGCDELTHWSSVEFDTLQASIAGSVDEAERVELAGEAARLMYEQAPIHALFYVHLRVAYRTDRFVDWIRQPTDTGLSLTLYFPEQSWTSIRPASEAASAEPSAETPTDAVPASAAPSASPAPVTPAPAGSDGTPVVAVVAIVAVAAVGGGLLLRRRRAA